MTNRATLLALASRLSPEWFGIGAFVGSQIVMAFTFIAEPGKWMFPHMAYGRAIIAYGYIALAFMAICGLTAASLRAIAGSMPND